MAKLLNLLDFVRFPFKCCKVFGFDPYKAGDENISWKRKLMSIYHQLVVANLILILVMTIIFVKKNIRDLALTTETVPGTGYAVLAIVKSVSISMRQQEFRDLMETLKGLFPKTVDEESSLEAKKYFKGYKRMERVFASIMCSVAVIFLVVPVIKLLLTGVWIDKLPFPMWFPFNEFNPWFYNLAFLWQMNNLFITIVSLLGPDLILYAFITLICMQYDNLCKRLLVIGDDPNFRTPATDASEKFIELVKLHETLIRLSRNLEKIYSASIFFNFFGSSILICLVGYQISVGIKSEILVKFAVFLAASSIQILLLCYYGNKLTTASGNVAEAAYASGWNKREMKEQKTFLLLMIQRSQRPAVISAFKFSVVSLNAFTTVSLPKVKRIFSNMNFFYRF